MRLLRGRLSASNLMGPFLSVVTVSLDAADTIEDTLASVCRQRVDFPIEHICVDGGSHDGTRSIIDDWAARSPCIVRVYERDNGIFDAMNRGLSVAKGEYVLFLNADDFLVRPTTLREAMHDLVPGSQSNPDLILGDAVMGVPGVRGFWRHRRVPRCLGRVRGLGLYPVHQGQFAKRGLLLSVGGFDAGLRVAADMNQYFDLERRFSPSTRLLRSDVAFMRAGGAANASFRAVRLGTSEIYHHLALRYSAARAAGMVCIKTLQSLSELRFGRCPHFRWFAEPAFDDRGGGHQ